MNCPECGTPDSTVPKTLDGPKDVMRLRRCRCGGTWRTKETIQRGSFKVPSLNTSVKPYTAKQGPSAGGISPNEGKGESGPGLVSSEVSEPEAPSEPQTCARRGRGDAKDYPSEFEQVWAGCKPKRGNKHPAFKAWVKLKPAAILVLRVYGLRLRTDGWQRGYIPYLSTWLNDRGWETEPDPSEFKAPTNGTKAEPFAVRAEREREERLQEDWADRALGGAR